jgi:hydrogenase small subunit
VRPGIQGDSRHGQHQRIFRHRPQALQEVEQRLEMPRREFLQFCATLAATLGLPAGAEAAVAKAVEAAKRPSVIWLHFQECTGCSESLLRAEHPTLEKLILDVISLDYHETLMAAAGHQAEAARKAAMKANKGKYVLVVEGAIPTKANGIYCKIGGQTAIDMLKECAADAAAVIAIGSCASWGGMPSTIPSISGADSSPTGSAGVAEILGKPVMTIPGCPPNPYNFLAAVVHFLTFGKLPELDKLGRPKFAYSRLIHENCERRAHFDAGRFAMEFGDEPATARATASTSSAARARRPMPTARPWALAMPARTTGRWAAAIPASAAPRRASASPSRSTRSPRCSTSTPPLQYPRIVEEQGKAASFASAAAVAAVAGAAPAPR